MAAEQRKLLEQLMGADMMNGMPTKPQVVITDPKACRSYMVGTCPHDLFTNTKQDLGPCPKIHNSALKEEYEAATEEQRQKWGFDFDYMRDMGRYIDDCNRKIDQAQKRLDKTPEEIRQTISLLKEIQDLTENIELGCEEVLILGRDLGHVQMAATEYFKLNVYKERRTEAERELKNLSDTSGPSGHQKLQVCDVCGAYLSRLDNDRRLADHFYGKMHLGYAQMRRTHETLSAQLKGRQPPPRAEDRGPPQDGGPYGGGRFGGYGGGGRGGGGGGGGGRNRGRRGDYHGNW